MDFRLRFFVGLSLVGGCLMSGCVDNRYDLSKEIDQNITVGGPELSIPVGMSEKLTLRKMIDSDGEESDLEVMPDGTYALMDRDQLRVRVPAIAAVSVTHAPFAITPFDLNRFNGVDVGPDIPLSALPDAPVSTSGLVEVNSRVPMEITNIKELTFQNEVVAELDIRIGGNMAQGVKKMKFKNFKITFPSYMVIRGADAATPNVYVVNEEFSVVDGFQKRVIIERLAFASNPIENGGFVITEPLTLIGELTITELTGALVQLAGVTFAPRVSLSRMDIKEVVGTITPNMQPVQQVWQIGDLPSFLQGDGVVLDVTPHISMQIANPLMMQVEAIVDIRPSLNGVLAPQGVNVSMQVAPAAVSNELTWSRYWVATSAEGAPAGFTHAPAPGLPALLRPMPNALQIDVNTHPTPGTVQRVDLSIAQYQDIEVDYEVNVPLSFGPELQIAYADTVKGLGKDLEEVLDKVRELQIYATAKSSIPMQIAVSGRAIDRRQSLLDNISVTISDPILSGGRDGSLTTSNTTIILKELVPGAFRTFDGLILDMKGSNSAAVAYTPLRPDQYLQLELKAKIPGGLDINLKN